MGNRMTFFVLFSRSLLDTIGSRKEKSRVEGGKLVASSSSSSFLSLSPPAQ